MEAVMTDAQKLEACRLFIQGWAWHGFNGSPYTEKQAIDLSNKISNDAWKNYERIFGRKP